MFWTKTKCWTPSSTNEKFEDLKASELVLVKQYDISFTIPANQQGCHPKSKPLHLLLKLHEGQVIFSFPTECVALDITMTSPLQFARNAKAAAVYGHVASMAQDRKMKKNLDTSLTGAFPLSLQWLSAGQAVDSQKRLWFL